MCASMCVFQCFYSVFSYAFYYRDNYLTKQHGGRGDDHVRPSPTQTRPGGFVSGKHRKCQTSLSLF